MFSSLRQVKSHLSILNTCDRHNPEHKIESCTVVVCPLQSITCGKIFEATSTGLAAKNVLDLNLDEIQQCRYRLTF